jgi:hypothetical protein
MSIINPEKIRIVLGRFGYGYQEKFVSSDSISSKSLGIFSSKEEKIEDYFYVNIENSKYNYICDINGKYSYINPIECQNFFYNKNENKKKGFPYKS